MPATWEYYIVFDCRNNFFHRCCRAAGSPPDNPYKSREAWFDCEQGVVELTESERRDTVESDVRMKIYVVENGLESTHIVV